MWSKERRSFMDRKTKLITLFSAAALATSIGAAIIAKQTSFGKSFALDDDYTITINPEDVTTSTTASATVQQFTVKTDQLKNNVTFDFVGVRYDSGTGKLIMEENGYIANVASSQIRSIKAVTIYGTGNVYDYEFGWEATGSTITYVENGYYWADGDDLDLTSYVPNYFKLQYRSVDVTISKIVFEYDNNCVVGENPTVIQGGLKYRKVLNDHAMLVGFAGSSFADVTVADTIGGLPVTEIGNYAFSADTTIENIDLGANVTKIGYESFKNATSLESVTGFANIEYISYAAFEGCSSLVGDISFSSNLTNISALAFEGTKITTVIFADTGNPYVADGAFRGARKLESVHIGSQITSFYEDFLYDESLEEITVGAGNTKYSAVENVLFDNESKVVRSIAAKRPQTSFTVPSGYTLKTYCAFGNQTLETLTLNESTNKIPDYSFNECINLKNINFGTCDSIIIEYAFKACYALETLNIPSNVKTITQGAFAYCSSLETVVFEEGCQKIERGAFKDCTSLKNVLLPTTLTSLGEAFSWPGDPVDVFEGCTALTKICTRLLSGTYSGANIVSGWDGGRPLAYESNSENLDGYHWRMVDGTPRIWGTVNVTFKIYRNDIGTGYGIYFLGTFNEWTANVDSRGSYVSDHWEITITLTSYETYEFKGAVGTWDTAAGLVYEAGNNHSFTPDDASNEYVINWQY